MDACFLSDVGKVRQINEDAGGIFYNRSGQMLATIADGMGGHKAGDVASQLTATYLKKLWEETEEFASEEEIKEWLEKAIHETNEHVLLHAKDSQDHLGMGTTIVVAVFYLDRVIVGHVGDSRLYYVSNEEIVQVTEDHSYVQELVKNGEITEAEAEAHPKKNVLLRAVGTEKDIAVDINSFVWNHEAYVLLCSDGLSNKITDEDMFQVVHSDLSLQEKVHELIHRANNNGGEDNISVILVHCNRTKAGEAS